jgi:uncharacterized repeat protein (TIGR03847 family)
MSNIEIELNPVDFITVGTIGPKGQRMFHLQAGKRGRIVSLIIEKEQAFALSEAINELINDIAERYPDTAAEVEDISNWDMDLREPIDPLFRVAQMGLGYDEDSNLVVLVAQELVVPASSDLDNDLGLEPETDEEEAEPGIVRFWGSREQMQALSLQATSIVQAGRPDPRQNGRLVYYWT